MRIDKRKRQRATIAQTILQLTNEVEHVGARRIRKHRISDDVIKRPGDAGKSQLRNSHRIEKEAIAIVKDPMRPRKRSSAALNRLPPDVDAPVSFLINRRIRIAQHVPDVSAEVENVFPTPVALVQLQREISKLPRFRRKKRQTVSSVRAKEFPVEIIRSAAVVEKRHKQHDHEHAFIDPDVRLGAHELELERRHQRARSLACFLFEVREHAGRHGGPGDWTIITDAHDADLYPISVTRDRALSYPACLAIRVHPAAEQFLQISSGLEQLGIQMAALFECCLCHSF
jgi:hypothetical protein